MSIREKTLVIPDRADPERDAVATAWSARGGEVVRLGRFWEPPELDPARVALYGYDTFCLVVAEKLNLTLVTPPDDLVLRLNPLHLKRAVGSCSIDEVASQAFPLFVKPMVPKQFAAAIHHSADSIMPLVSGLAGDTLVLFSEVVPILAEARAFVLDSSVRDVGVYEGSADAFEAAEFLAAVASEESGPVMPSTYVLDAALTADRGWVVVEANASWGAGLNGCAAAKVVECIEAATMGSYNRGLLVDGGLPPSSLVGEPEPGRRVACPCCRYLTLSHRGGFEICPVCFWEDDGQDDYDADSVRGGPNGALSLSQARCNFASFGACDERSKSLVRGPRTAERGESG